MRDQDLLVNVVVDATEVAEEDITTIISMAIITIEHFYHYFSFLAWARN